MSKCQKIDTDKVSRMLEIMRTQIRLLEGYSVAAALRPSYDEIIVSVGGITETIEDPRGEIAYAMSRTAIDLIGVTVMELADTARKMEEVVGNDEYNKEEDKNA